MFEFKMPFNSFKYNVFLSSKRYHTAAKHSTAFFDSSFNHIRQNTQLVSLESLSHGAKRQTNPHPASTATPLLLQDQQQQQQQQQQQHNLSDDELLHPSLLAGHFYALHPQAVALNAGLTLLTGTLAQHHNLHHQQAHHPHHHQQHQQHKLQHQQIPLRKHIHTSATSAPGEQQQQHQHQDTKGTQRGQKNTQRRGRVQDIKSAKKDEQRESTLVTQEPTPESSPKFFQDVELASSTELTDETFLNHLTSEIDHAYLLGQYEKVNALYMAIKRNNIVPSREVYYKVLSSICQRTIDHSVDEQLSTLLNVYQDLLSNKIKPDLNIYSTVIYKLLDSSINASMIPNVSNNGSDFFKIAIDIFNASNCSHVQQYDSKITDLILIGMNLYPNLINHQSLIKILSQQTGFVKNHIYYSSLINYCQFTNHPDLATALYEEFKSECSTNFNLKQNQFIVYSSFIATLVSTGEVSLATKFLDKLLTTIKKVEDYESKVSMLLTSYLLSLSKVNHEKSLEIWLQFNKIDWIPEFSYEFYLNLLQDSLHMGSYDMSLKLYNYMSALPRSLKFDSIDLDTVLIKPRKVDSISSLIMAAISQNDKSTVLKVLKESFIKKHGFDYEVYPVLATFFNNEDLIVRITNMHGLASHDGFQFLSFLSSKIPNFPIYDISKTEFFKKLVDEFSLDESSINKDYYGFIQVWKSVCRVDQVSSQHMELASRLILEFYDLQNYYLEMPTRELVELKFELTNYFKYLHAALSKEELQNASHMVNEAFSLLFSTESTD